MKTKMTEILAVILAACMLTACAGGTSSAGGASSAGGTSSESTADDSSSAITSTPAVTTTTAAESEPEVTTTATPETTPAETTATTPAEATAATPAETAAAPVETTAATAETTPAEAQPEESTPQEEVMADKIIALTFDDGPNTTTTNEVLDMLEKHGIAASFFLIGNNINDASAEVVKRAYNMGCEIHNHSRSHPYMNEMTADEIIAEFRYTDDKVYEITGERTKFFRPPYIAVSDTMFEEIDVPFIAGIGCNDWDDKIPAERRALSILRQAKDGDIILLHDAEGNSKTVEALDTIIPELKAQGYRFVTVTELFEEKGIEISAEDTKIYTNVMQQNQYG